MPVNKNQRETVINKANHNNLPPITSYYRNQETVTFRKKMQPQRGNISKTTNHSINTKSDGQTFFKKLDLRNRDRDGKIGAAEEVKLENRIGTKRCRSSEQ